VTRLTRVAVIPLIALLLAACGARGSGPGVATVGGKATATPTGKAENLKDKQRKFAQCMRDNGVDMPDPKTGEEGGVVFAAPAEGEPTGGTFAVDENMKKAMEKCKQYMPSGGDLPKPKPEDIEKMRAMAKCMREHGVNMPDPDSEGRVNLDSDSAPDLEKFKEANKACAHLGPGGRDGGAAVNVGPGS